MKSNCELNPVFHSEGCRLVLGPKDCPPIDGGFSWLTAVSPAKYRNNTLKQVTKHRPTLLPTHFRIIKPHVITRQIQVNAKMKLLQPPAPTGQEALSARCGDEYLAPVENRTRYSSAVQSCRPSLDKLNFPVSINAMWQLELLSLN